MEVTLDSSSPNHRTLTFKFFGKSITTTVTATPSVVRRWLRTTLHYRRRHLQHLVVGMGVQWVHNELPASTLQLCVGRRCLIFQLAHSDSVPKLLRRFLLNPNITFVGIWNYLDARKLLISKHELKMLRGQPLDLRKHVRARNGEKLNKASLEKIVEECLGHVGVRLEPGISMSNWGENSLSNEQVSQTCVDAYVSFQIGKNVGAWQLIR